MFREYRTAHGRWTSPDPAGTGTVDPNNPQSWNRYSYLLNNPTGLVDPLGLDCSYYDDSGDNVESVDANSSPSECSATGGTWTPPIDQQTVNVTASPASGPSIDDGSISAYSNTTLAFAFTFNAQQSIQQMLKAMGNTAMKQFCGSSISSRVLRSMRNGALLGAGRGAVVGFIGGEAVAGEFSFGLSGLGGAAFGATVRGIAGAGGGVFTGFALGEACQAAGAYN